MNYLIYIFSFIFLVNEAGIKEKITIFMIGDSTMANKDANKFPETGWGQVFGQFFNDKIDIINKAVNGRSTKSFRDEGRWDYVMTNLKPGNYVFIEFGHNDEKLSSPKLGTTLDRFQTNLIRYIKDTRSKGGLPVLLTPVERRIFKSNQLVDSHGGYPDVVRKVAKEHKVPLIDMQLKSRRLILQTGEKQSMELFLHADSNILANYPNGISDNTHFSTAGATQMARLVAESIRELNLPLRKYLLR